ncbi:MAG: histidine kinase N-terminal 7TM domain-containing protein, partial [Halobacteriota archaeon]
MVTVNGPDVIGVLMILGALPSLYLVWVLWDIRYNVSVMWFTVAVAVFSLWVVTLGATLLVPSDRVVVGLLFFARIVGILSTLSLFFFVVEYTIGKTIPVRTILLFLVVPAITVGGLLLRPASFMTVQFGDRPYTLAFGQFGFVHIGYSLLLNVMSLTLLFRGYLVTSGKQRKQVTLILAWYVIAVVTVFMPIFSPLPNYVNPGIFGLLALLIGTTYSLRTYGLFTIVPLDKTDVFDAIEDAVVMLNMEGSVIDYNRRATEQFSLSARDLGQSVTTVLAAYPALQELIESEETAKTITKHTARGDRHFAATTSPFSYGRGMSGTILVLRDITPIKDREAELDLLRQVFSRVFRHNIRNELNLISGHLRDMQSQNDDEQVQRIRSATRATDRILDHTDKARQAEEVVGESHEILSWPFQKLVSDIVSNCRERYPDATIINTVDDVSILAIPGFEKAIEGGIENAVEHNPSPVVVELSSEVDDDTVTLVIEDDGVGIPETEIIPLTEEQETAISQSSGV